MIYRRTAHINCILHVVAGLVIILLGACNPTRHLATNEYLLQKNLVILKSSKPIANKGEVKDNLAKMVMQKTNTRSLWFLRYKLYKYNRKYTKWHDKADSLLPKSVERPAIFDSSLVDRSKQVMKSYLFNQGFFYAVIKDTVVYKGKTATVTYKVETGKNFTIGKVAYDVPDSTVSQLMQQSYTASPLQEGTEFAYILLEEERSRLTTVLRNKGYYKFTQDNVTFKLDTLDKSQMNQIGNPIARAMGIMAKGNAKKRNTIDIRVKVRIADDTAAFRKYTIGSVSVFPDFNNRADLRDTLMLKKFIDSISYKYHTYYVRPRVLHEHIYLYPGKLYSEADYNKTHNKLNELGIFQYLRIEMRENRQNRKMLDCTILLNKAKKYDFSTNMSASSGTTYAFGNAVGLNFRNRNFMKGANLLTIGVNGGLELSYNDQQGTDFTDHFSLLTWYYGLNASIDFPKFLAPVAASLFDNSNLPHTIISGGANVIDRVNYFKLSSTGANFSYNWQETETKAWALSPAFFNLIRLPNTTDSFQHLLDSNAYLRNSYKENFIEGESITFKFDNNAKKRGRNYTYVKLSFEEAGGILGAVNQLGVALNDLYKIEFAQYTKFDFDIRHFATVRHSVFATRFYGGIGVPYGQSPTLPYIKQYFSGGPYSLRGWRIRTLGPGTYYKSSLGINQIDRTGDIKLEFNGEYRFPIAPLFAGLMKMNGVAFADAGNIWLAKADENYPGGNLTLANLRQGIAADLGVGLRFDILSFLTIRTELAMPVKKPYEPTNDGWVFSQINMKDANWRSDNLIFLISIGYPF